VRERTETFFSREGGCDGRIAVLAAHQTDFFSTLGESKTVLKDEVTDLIIKFLAPERWTSVKCSVDPRGNRPWSQSKGFHETSVSVTSEESVDSTHYPFAQAGDTFHSMRRRCRGV